MRERAPRAAGSMRERAPRAVGVLRAAGRVFALRLVPLSALSLVVLGAARASAAELVWSAPEACPTQAAVTERLELAIGVSLDHTAPLVFRLSRQ